MVCGTHEVIVFYTAVMQGQQAIRIFVSFHIDVTAGQAQGLPYPRRTPMDYDGSSVYLGAVYSFN